MENGVFDTELYLSSNHEVDRMNLNPVVHYLFYGRFQGKSPGPLFFTAFYVNTDPASEKNGIFRLFQWMFHPSREFRQKPFYEILQEMDTPGSYEPEKIIEIPETSIKPIAFYLPQFHPFDENDRFWGKGFTEWHNVARALPLFHGHHQPKIPGTLGFYDLRSVEVLKKQISLARQHGIYGFCFHHYFLGGKPVMRAPFDLFMQHKELKMPFCLNWANEPWTVRWDGNRNREGVLLDQLHDDQENRAFFMDILPALKDSRYIHIDGRPLLLIYRPGLFPDFKKTVALWNRQCLENGIRNLYIVMVRTLFDKENGPDFYGCDAAVEFPPHLVPRLSVRDQVTLFDAGFKGYVYDYKAVVNDSMTFVKPGFTLFRGIIPQWDNTARNKAATIYYGSTPELYQKWLTELGRYTEKNLPANKQFIFINAWNEWAEGACLEPDHKFGYAYLNATSGALHEMAVNRTMDPKIDTMNAKNRKCICIIGMHRSGTSTISGLLHTIGLDLGRNIIPPRYDNPKGFFENIPVNHFNDKLLSKLGGAWHDTMFLGDYWWENEEIQTERTKVTAIINEEFYPDATFVIKDPRISILLPFYLKVFEMNHIDPCFIICFRNPFEVAASLKTRDNLPGSSALLLWMDHTLKAELYSRPYPRMFLNYHDVLSDPAGALHRVAGALHLPDPEIRENLDQINGFIDTKLRNQIANNPHPNEIPLVNELYNVMEQEKTGELTRQAMDCFDRIRKEFYQNLNFYHGWDREMETTIQIVTGSGQLISTSFKTSRGSNQIDFKPDIKEPLSLIMVKPLNQKTVVNIKSVLLQGSDGASVSPDRQKSNATLVTKDQIYIFNTALPEITFHFTSPVEISRIFIDFTYLSIGG